MVNEESKEIMINLPMVLHVKMQLQVLESMSCHQLQFPVNPNLDQRQTQIFCPRTRSPLEPLE